MLLATPILAFAIPLVSAKAADIYSRFAPRAEGIEWGPCALAPNTTALSCGYFEVPLDWADDSKGNGRLAVARYQVDSSTRLGTLFTNPGGPGESGVGFVIGQGQMMAQMSAGLYDIVSWDPRGVGETIPGKITCFDSEEAYTTFWNNTLVSPPLDVRGNFTEQTDIDYFYSQVPVLDALWPAFGQICLEGESGQYLPYVGTAATARDMVALASYLDGDDAPVNYWGLSYGTTIGNYFINMFPDRVGRVILDGVEDPVTHASQPSHLYWAKRVESVDETYAGFAYGCAMAGPSGCKLSTSTSTGPGIIQWTYDFLDFIYDYSHKSGDDSVTARAVRGAIHQKLYQPTAWANFANTDFYTTWQALVNETGEDFQLASRSAPELSRFWFPRAGEESQGVDYTFQAITCGDSIDQDYITTKEVFDELLRVVRDVSPMFGSQFPQPAHICHRWPARAAERFTGPWNHTLANPILIIGNKADPATPFKDALAVADMLGDNAILIEQDGFGHLSLAQKSRCTAGIAERFFVNGTLPVGDDTICEIDADGPPLFPGQGVTAFGIQSALSDSDKSTSSHDDTEEPSDDEIESEIEQVKKEKKTLMIVVITLSVVAGLLLIGLLVSLFVSRQKRSYAPVPT